jgi:hypothetical protein
VIALASLALLDNVHGANNGQAQPNPQSAIRNPQSHT